jgi:hypothetical protein
MREAGRNDPVSADVEKQVLERYVALSVIGSAATWPLAAHAQDVQWLFTGALLGVGLVLGRGVPPTRLVTAGRPALFRLKPCARVQPGRFISRGCLA